MCTISTNHDFYGRFQGIINARFRNNSAVDYHDNSAVRNNDAVVVGLQFCQTFKSGVPKEGGWVYIPPIIWPHPPPIISKWIPHMSVLSISWKAAQKSDHFVQCAGRRPFRPLKATSSSQISDHFVPCSRKRPDRPKKRPFRPKKIGHYVHFKHTLNCNKMKQKLLNV